MKEGIPLLLESINWASSGRSSELAIAAKEAVYLEKTDRKFHDSLDEAWLDLALIEMRDAGLIQFSDFPDPLILRETVSVPYPEQLKTKKSWRKRNFIPISKYTPDRIIVWNLDKLESLSEDFKLRFPMFRVDSNSQQWIMDTTTLQKSELLIPVFRFIIDGEHYGFSILDVKPSNKRRVGGNKHRGFNDKLHLFYERYGLFVSPCPIVPDRSDTQTFFTHIFTPMRFLWTAKMTQRRKLHFKPQLLKDFL